MIEVFADTFYWLAMLNPDDRHHAEVASYSVVGKIVTSTAVQLEVMDALAQTPLERVRAIEFWDWSNTSSSVDVIRLNVGVMETGVALYRRRMDKQWSLTECISFEIMQERGIADALTADRHFRQAGFNAVFLK